jgi:hypothetical protein
MEAFFVSNAQHDTLAAVNLQYLDIIFLFIKQNQNKILQQLYYARLPFVNGWY